MPLYLIEVYLPQSRTREARESGRRVRAAAEELARESFSIRYVRTTFLPDDETCFHLLEASSADVVAEASGRAELGRTRVTAVVDASDTTGRSRA